MEAIRSLQPLEQLAVLTIVFTDVQAHLVAVQQEKMANGEDEDHQQQLPSLPGVKHLNLAVYVTSHRDMDLLQMDQLLPGLERIHCLGTIHRCRECGDFGPVHARKQSDAIKGRIGRCVEHLVRGMVQRMPRLSTQIDMHY